MGGGSIDIAKVNTTAQCVLGKWLDNEGYRMIPTELHDEICAVHKEFHQIAAGIIQKIKEKRFAEARADISQNGNLDRVSLRLRGLLLKLSLREPSRAVPTSSQYEQAPSTQGSEESARNILGRVTTVQCTRLIVSDLIHVFREKSPDPLGPGAKILTKEG